MMEKRVHINYGASLTIPAGTQVGVYTDAACTVLATIYADDGVTPAVNPVIVDVNGEFSYRAANGVYFEKIGVEPVAELRFNDGTGGAGSSGALGDRPVPSVTHRGRFYNCEGAGDDGEDVLTVCLLSSTGSYTWRVVTTMFGGPA